MSLAVLSLMVLAASRLDLVRSELVDSSSLREAGVVSHLACVRPAARNAAIRPIKLRREGEVAQLRAAMPSAEPQVQSFLAISSAPRVERFARHPISARAPPVA
jgi:hypothetical protein